MGMKDYLIIGASSGIGKAIAAQLAAEGHRVHGTYHQHEMADGEGISYSAYDVLSAEAPDFIPEKLDGLVYCPGSINLLPFKRIKPEAFEADYALQVVGAVKVIQAAHSALKKGDNASIVLFSTVAVQSGFNFHAQVAASKGAIEGLTRSLAAEFAPTVRVNAIAPSLTDTPLASKLLNSEEKRQANAERHPLKRVGHVDDIAAAASFLLSDRSSWMTGQILAVDGGKSSINA